MSTSQIRINKTKDIQEILDSLKKEYKAMSESEIAKLALSKLYIMHTTVKLDPIDDIDYAEGDDPNEQWETIVDFTEGGKQNGMPIDNVIDLLKKSIAEDEQHSKSTE